jgi:Tol biopolymer transport system component
VDRHKVNPVWHPSGRYIAVQGEMDTHPFDWLNRDRLLSELVVNGLWTNIYVTTPDGAQWFRLTDYSTTQADGAAHVHFSADGTKLAWSRLIESASETARWGKWKMLIVDFVVTDGVPSLQNIRDMTPANGVFVGANGFSPDGRKVLFTGDMENTHDWGHDIWTLELASGQLVNLTKSGYWDEHAQYSPSGEKIVYMSSEPYPSDVFKTELMVINVDGTAKRQLTHFNVPGFAESVDEKSMPT